MPLSLKFQQYVCGPTEQKFIRSDDYNFEQRKAIGQSGQSVLSGQWAPLHSHARSYKDIMLHDAFLKEPNGQ